MGKTKETKDGSSPLGKMGRALGPIKGTLGRGGSS